MFHLKLRETCLTQHLAGNLLTPHCPKPCPIIRQRDGHAMIARNCVEKRCQGMLHVLLEQARCPDIKHQKDASRAQSFLNSLEDFCRSGLVVDRVKGSDEIVVILNV